MAQCYAYITANEMAKHPTACQSLWGERKPERMRAREKYRRCFYYREPAHQSFPSSVNQFNIKLYTNLMWTARGSSDPKPAIIIRLWSAPLRHLKSTNLTKWTLCYLKCVFMPALPRGEHYLKAIMYFSHYCNVMITSRGFHGEMVELSWVPDRELIVLHYCGLRSWIPNTFPTK